MCNAQLKRQTLEGSEVTSALRTRADLDAPYIVDHCRAPDIIPAHHVKAHRQHDSQGIDTCSVLSEVLFPETHMRYESSQSVLELVVSCNL